MRFAVATTVLANTLPAALRPNGAVEARQERTALWRSLHQSPASDRPPQVVKSVIAARRRKLGAGGLLKNSLSSSKASTLVECDPDVGVLVCGAGEYCHSNPESSLGGVCLPVASEFQRGLQEAPAGR